MLANKEFDEIGESDLRQLVEAGVPEGRLVEYKSAAYETGDAGTKEFLKDISSFANSSGGHLIIGMQEAAGGAYALTPLMDIDPDRELQRLENLVRDGLEPRVVGIRMKSIPIDGGYVFVIRTPKSWNPPHRVSARGRNRFYARTSAGA